MAHRSLNGIRRSSRLQSSLPDEAHGAAATPTSPPALTEAPVTASRHSEPDLSGQESSPNRPSDAIARQQTIGLSASKSNALMLQQCGSCSNCVQPWLNRTCCEERGSPPAGGTPDPAANGTRWPGLEPMERQTPYEKNLPALLEPKQMAVRERQLQRQLITDGILEGSHEDRQESRRDTVTKEPVPSAEMAHRHMVRHLRHQRHMARASDEGSPTLDWAQLQDGSELTDVVPHLRADATDACRACGAGSHTTRGCPLLNVTRPPRVFRCAPPANSTPMSPKRRRRSVAPELPVEGQTCDMAVLPPALLDAMAAMQQFAVEAAHEQGTSTGEKSKVVAAFSPDALTVAGLFSAEVLRTSLKAAMPP